MSERRQRTIAEQDDLLLEIYALSRKFAVGLVDEQDVDDLVHDVTADALATLRAGEWAADPINLPAFVRKMVRHQVINMYRRQCQQDSHDGDHYNDRSALAPTWTLADRASDEESIEEFRAWLTRKLPQRCRQAYWLARVEGLTHAEVSRCLGVSVKTVQTFVRDAHRILRSELEREGISAKPAADRRRADRAWRASGDERFAAGYVPREDKAVSTQR